jgi:hypothetical protein
MQDKYERYEQLQPDTAHNQPNRQPYGHIQHAAQHVVDKRRAYRRALLTPEAPEAALWRQQPAGDNSARKAQRARASATWRAQPNQVLQRARTSSNACKAGARTDGLPSRTEPCSHHMSSTLCQTGPRQRTRHRRRQQAAARAHYSTCAVAPFSSHKHAQHAARAPHPRRSTTNRRAVLLVGSRSTLRRASRYVVPTQRSPPAPRYSARTAKATRARAHTVGSTSRAGVLQNALALYAAATGPFAHRAPSNSCQTNRHTAATNVPGHVAPATPGAQTAYHTDTCCGGAHKIALNK